MVVLNLVGEARIEDINYV